MGEVDPSSHHVKILIWQKMVQEWGREMFIFHTIIPTVYPFW